MWLGCAAMPAVYLTCTRPLDLMARRAWYAVVDRARVRDASTLATSPHFLLGAYRPEYPYYPGMAYEMAGQL